MDQTTVETPAAGCRGVVKAAANMAVQKDVVVVKSTVVLAGGDLGTAATVQGAVPAGEGVEGG